MASEGGSALCRTENTKFRRKISPSTPYHYKAYLENCQACGRVMESPEFGPFCEVCHDFLYPDAFAEAAKQARIGSIDLSVPHESESNSTENEHTVREERTEELNTDDPESSDPVLTKQDSEKDDESSSKSDEEDSDSETSSGDIGSGFIFEDSWDHSNEFLRELQQRFTGKRLVGEFVLKELEEIEQKFSSRLQEEEQKSNTKELVSAPLSENTEYHQCSQLSLDGNNLSREGSYQQAVLRNEFDRSRITSCVENIRTSSHSDEEYTRDSHSRPCSPSSTTSSGYSSSSESEETLSPAERLPPEVLLIIFSLLDDASLQAAHKVCQQWYRLASDFRDWKVHVKRRWPLLQPKKYVRCWRTLYMKLLEGVTCRRCLEQGYIQRSPLSDYYNTWRNKRLRSELKNLLLDSPEGIRAYPLDHAYSHWKASITGPPNSPFEGGIFYLHLELPKSYPMRPPIVRFITRIFHPNVSSHGDIGLDALRHNWSLALTIPKILVSVQSLLTDPFCHVCMEPEIARIYLQEYPEYARIAKACTERFAMAYKLV